MHCSTTCLFHLLFGFPFYSNADFKTTSLPFWHITIFPPQYMTILPQHMTILPLQHVTICHPNGHDHPPSSRHDHPPSSKHDHPPSSTHDNAIAHCLPQLTDLTSFEPNICIKSNHFSIFDLYSTHCSHHASALKIPISFSLRYSQTELPAIHSFNIQSLSALVETSFHVVTFYIFLA